MRNLSNAVHCLRSKLALLAVLTLSVLTISSCSKDKRAELLKNVSDDAAFVTTANPSAFIKSAGGNTEDDKITVPDAFAKIAKSELGKDGRQLIKLLESVEGINLESMTVAMYDREDCKGSIMFYVTDRDDLTKWLEDNDLEQSKSGDYITFTGDNDLNIVLDGHIGHVCFCSDIDDGVDYVKEIKGKADRKPLEAWKTEYLTGEAVFSALVMIDNFDDSMARAMRSDETNPDLSVIAGDIMLDGLHMAVNIKSLDKDGKPVDYVAEGSTGSLDPEMFNYFAEDYTLFGGVSLEGKAFKGLLPEVMRGFNTALLQGLFNDDPSDYIRYYFDEYGTYQSVNPFQDAANSDNFTQPSSKVNGLAFGLNIKPNAKVDLSDKSSLKKALTATALFSFKNADNAASYFDAWKNMHLNGSDVSDKKISFTPYDMNGENVFMLLKGDDVLLSTKSSVNAGEPQLPGDLSNAAAFLSLNLPKSSPVLKALPVKVNFGIKAWLKVSNNSATLDLTLTDTEGGLLENFLNLARTIGKFDDNSSHSYEYADTVDSVCYDYAVVDSTYDYADTVAYY